MHRLFKRLEIVSLRVRHVYLHIVSKTLAVKHSLLVPGPSDNNSQLLSACHGTEASRDPVSHAKELGQTCTWLELAVKDILQLAESISQLTLQL